MIRNWDQQFISWPDLSTKCTYLGTETFYLHESPKWSWKCVWSGVHAGDYRNPHASRIRWEGCWHSARLKGTLAQGNLEWKKEKYVRARCYCFTVCTESVFFPLASCPFVSPWMSCQPERLEELNAVQSAVLGCSSTVCVHVLIFFYVVPQGSNQGVSELADPF